MLTRGRNQFSIADQTFLNPRYENHKKRLSLYDYRYYNQVTSGGRNNIENGYSYQAYEGISGGRNSKTRIDESNKEVDNEDNEYYYNKNKKLFKNYNPNELAIKHLKDFIWDTFLDLLQLPNDAILTILYKEFFVRYLGFNKEEIYDEMTYNFHYIPDYTDENIENIIINIINSYEMRYEMTFFKPPKREQLSRLMLEERKANRNKEQMDNKKKEKRNDKGKFSNPKDRQKRDTFKKRQISQLIVEGVEGVSNLNSAITGGKKMNSVSKQKKNARSTRRKRNNKIE